MNPFNDLSKLNDNIIKIKDLLAEIQAMSQAFPAIARNSKRASASIKMMELNISDLLALDLGDD